MPRPSTQTPRTQTLRTQTPRTQAPRTQALRPPELEDALLDLFPSLGGESDLSGLKLLRHEHIAVRPQPRATFSPAEVSELAASISQLRERGEGVDGTGILQPLLVVPLADGEKLAGEDVARYHLVAGERRFRASQEAGLKQVPALVLPPQRQGVLLVQLIENLQRQELPPLEEARALRALMDEQGLSYRDAARMLGKSRSYLSDRLALLKMGSDVQALVSARADTLHHARVLDAVQDETLRRELIQATYDGASRREIERRVENAQGRAEATQEGEDEIAAEDKNSTEASNTKAKNADHQEVSARADSDTMNGSKSAHNREPAGDTASLTKQNASSASLLAHLRPAAAMTAEAARLIEREPERFVSEAEAVREQLDTIEEQVQRVRSRL